jgi:hypothetical protein
MTATTEDQSVRIRFLMNGVYQYFVRHESETQIRIDERQGVAARLSREGARRQLEVIRKLDPKADVKIITASGVELQYDEPTPDLGEDLRRPVFVIPDDLEATQLGFVVRPAYRVGHGRVWVVKPEDVPSMLLHATATESVYDADPVTAVAKARAAWGNMAEPIPHPDAERLANEEAHRVVQSILQPHQNSNVRPGDRR